MLIPNHPDPERLSALASGDTDATADAWLSEHVSTCVSCTALVEELGALRMSLAELPDLRPHRPLRLLPEVADEPARIDRVGGWARRIFAPVLTAGAALAMVGLIGTTVPALDGAATGGSPLGVERDTMLEGAAEPDSSSPAAEPGSANFGVEDATSSDVSRPLQSGAGRLSIGEESEADSDRELLDGTTAERSPWPMVLFTGVALMIAAGLLRWILAPRTG